MDSAFISTHESKPPVVHRDGQATTSPRNRLYWLLIVAPPPSAQVLLWASVHVVSPGVCAVKSASATTGPESPSRTWNRKILPFGFP